MSMPNSMNVDTSQVILHGVASYALTKLSGYLHKPALSLLEEYVKSIYQPAEIQKTVPFRLEDLEEVLSLCLEYSPFFNANTLKVEKHFEASFLVGNRVNVLGDLVTIIAYLGNVQKNGVIKLRFHYDEEFFELHAAVKGSALSRDELQHIHQAISGRDLVLNGVHELMVSFPCTAIGYKSNEKREKFAPPKDKFSYLYQIAGDMPGMVQDIIQTIVDVIPEELTKMKASLNSQDYAAVREVAHKIKSNFRSIEKENIAVLLEKIEAAAKSGDLPVLTQLVSQFATEADIVVLELKDYVD